MKRQSIILSALLIIIAAIFNTNNAKCAEEEKIGMVTGSKTGTYIKFGNDIKRVAKSVGLDIWVRNSEGSFQNIELMMSRRENAALGIVQSDVLRFLQKSNNIEKRRAASKLRLIFPFYNEEVHLFANKRIKSITDLNGKRVSIGTLGSGSWITATTLLNSFKVVPKESITDLKPPDAAAAVLSEKVDAMFYVAGKPVALFKILEEAKTENQFAPDVQNVHFVPLDINKTPKVYVSSLISPNDYTWLDKTITTIAVKAVLVSYDFSSRHINYFNNRCNQLSRLGQAIRENIEYLKNKGHKKWIEVDLHKELGIWPLDVCSRKYEPQKDFNKEEKYEIYKNYFEQKSNNTGSL